VLLVDRDNGYNRVKCRIQYCYARLMRDVEDLRDEFADQAEVQSFAATVISLLADAMHLHSKPLGSASHTSFALAHLAGSEWKWMSNQCRKRFPRNSEIPPPCGVPRQLIRPGPPSSGATTFASSYTRISFSTLRSLTRWRTQAAVCRARWCRSNSSGRHRNTKNRRS